MNASPAVVVTGVGCTLPGCASPEVLWRRLMSADTAVSAYANPSVESAQVRCFGHVGRQLDDEAREVLPFKLRRFASPCSSWGLRAALAAIADSGVNLHEVPEERRGIFASQGDYQFPSLLSFEEGIAAIRRRQRSFDAVSFANEFLRERGAEPFFAVKSLANNLLAVTSMALHLRGDCGAFVQDDSAPWAALRNAMLSLQYGDCDVAVVVGAGSFDEPLTLAELQAYGRLSACAEGPRSCRPFDVQRDGGVAGEGAVAFVLETSQNAAARRASPLATISGMASVQACDDLVYARCTQWAAEESGVSPDQIDAIIATGCGESEADTRESRMLCALPAPCATLPITASTPITGMVPGCAVHVLTALLMLRYQQVPPIAHLVQPEQTALRWVLGAPIDRPLRHVLAFSAGWLGSHSAMLLSHPSDQLQRESECLA